MAEIRFHLTPLTPIHAGSGESLEPFEYVVDGGTLYRFSLDEFMLALPREAQAHFVQAVERSVPLTRRFVAEHAAVARRLARFTAAVSPAAQELYERLMAGGEAHPEVLAVIRTGDRAYLPGSSLKGALRTALLYCAMARDNPTRDARALEQEVFRFRTVQEDPFRAFKVGDGSPLGAPTSVRAVAVHTQRAGGWQKDLDLLAEMVPGALSDGAEGVSAHAATFDANFYRYHQAAFPLTPGAVVAACRDFYGAHLAAEQRALQGLPAAAAAYRALAGHAANLPDHACLVRLAWGSGRDATTVAYGLRGARSPRSRRLADGGWPLGWAELAVVDAEGRPAALDVPPPAAAAPAPPTTLAPGGGAPPERRALADLRPGMVLDARVKSVVEFGVFCDVGAERDGLIHSSRLRGQELRRGQRVRVKVLTVDAARNRLGLDLVEGER